MDKTFDCIVCGSCVVDILTRPISLTEPIGAGKLIHVGPIETTTGGIVSNSGIAMARLGMRVGAFSYVGQDDWASIIRRKYQTEGIDTSGLMDHPEKATSTTVVMIDQSGERSFAHCVGAPEALDKRVFLDNLSLFAKSRMLLLGYYSLMPDLELDLPEVFAAIRETGCMTAMDAAGAGGDLKPLDKILPHLDIYVPSYDEAVHQTNETDPEKIIEIYRSCGAQGLLGVKLGSKGAILSPADGDPIHISCIAPPGGQVVDTTGAGDSFYAGLLTGLLRGLPVQQAGQLASASGACCVSGLGASAGLRDFEETAALANL